MVPARRLNRGGVDHLGGSRSGSCDFSFVMQRVCGDHYLWTSRLILHDIQFE